MITLTDKNFQQEIIDSKATALVDFWGAWCRPCHAIAPVVQRMSERFPDVLVGKVNVEENPLLRDNWAIDALPSLLFFKDGKEVKRLVGIQAETTLATLLESMI